MKTKIKKYTKEILYIVLMMTLFGNAISWYKSQDLNKAPLNLSSLTLIDGSKQSLETDKPILIHFWATWCPVCKLEASNINFIAKHFNVITIAVNSKNSANIQKYMQENHYSFKVVNDAQSLLASQFKIAGFPTTFIYDKHKNLCFNEVGYTSIIGLYVRMWWASL